MQKYGEFMIQTFQLYLFIHANNL